MKILRSLGRFLWDFLIGDTPELFLGGIFTIVVAWIAQSNVPTASPVIIPLAVAGVMATSLWRARRP